MRIIYHKSKFGLRKFRINRSRDARRILIKQQLDQLFTHDKLKTTYDVAKGVRPTVERVISIAKKFVETENQRYFRKVNGNLD